MSSNPTGQLKLSQTASYGAGTDYWGTNGPDANNIYIGSSDFSPFGSAIAYVFAEVPSFSKFGSYTGNGSADGPFVYCGFKPRWIMLKKSSSNMNGASWYIFDGTRDSCNPAVHLLAADTTGAESIIASNPIDFLSNGFKLRAADTFINEGQTYIFAAFAEAPFKYANAR
jgi:hypothetical protein